MELSILCITKGDKRVLPNLRTLSQFARQLDNVEFVIALDSPFIPGDVLSEQFDRIVCVQSKGFLESVLDEAISYCRGQYVFRIDDDEVLGNAMRSWLEQRRYLAADHWRFPRAWFWHNELLQLMLPHFWPDEQTRLSVREKAGQRIAVHAGSPFGSGRLAPVPLLHNKFLLYSKEEREALIRHYDQIAPGAGSNFQCFYVPEYGPLTLGTYDESKIVAEQAFRSITELQYYAAQYSKEMIDCGAWLLENIKPQRMLEIGTHQGGTAAFWCELAPSVFSIDLPDGLFGGIGWDGARARNERLQRDYPGVYEGVLADSHLASTLEIAAKRGPFDVVFIDADHRYEGVKQDLEMYSSVVRPGGAILFHDIVDTAFTREQGCYVAHLWNELKFRADAQSFLVSPEGGNFGGIGMIRG